MFFLHLFHGNSIVCRLSLQSSSQTIGSRYRLCIGSFNGSRICSSIIGSNGSKDSTQSVVNSSQIRIDFLGVESFPKLKISRTLQELSHTFRFFDTRKFHHDTSHLTFQSLNIGLNHTKAVDTGTQYIIRVIDSSFDFFTQHLFYISIRAAGIYFVFQLLSSEQFCQLSLWSFFLILSDKQSNKVILAGNRLFGSF